ncbi:MAG: nucleotidyltransferase domain-containing protein [Bacteroidales bacterium]|nr:nucleotidyltransferase domain-containing protein [Bacteroidales bacterium]
MSEVAVNIIKEEFKKEHIQVLKVLLFGSRAIEKAKIGSDWDFLVLLNKELGFHAQWNIVKKIKRKLAEKKIPNDIIVRSVKKFEEDKNNTGSIIYYANKQAVEL